MLVAVSIVAFIIISLPPGDFADSYAANKISSGETVTLAEIEAIRRQFGLDKPLYLQYFKWIGGMVYGDFGYSWGYSRPVTEVIGERLPMTILIATGTLLFTYITAIPLGIYSALRQYSVADYTFTILGYIGLATPNFLLALLLMFGATTWFGVSVGGLFSLEYQDAAWSMGRVWDLLSHIWVPIIVLGTAGTAFQLRIMRATLLEELNKMYVTAARATGLSEFRMILKYPVRLALNPIVSTLGWELTTVISGAPIIGLVLSLPDTGPMFINALRSQDMFLAGAMMLIYCILVMIGSFISDILLMIVDPRVRMGAST
ncbi:MAG: ABC transporter permease [Rhizobiales bacterium]|nr:ABC transporter permease [Hyphomicrobiales bacterium]NRB15486.1 ABC transporter permease [Hyphomicrobiales bacterium]